MKRKIKSIIKKFVSYTIEDDMRIYRLKHTPIRVKISLTKHFLKRYGNLSVIPNKIVCNNYMGNGYGCNAKYVVEALLGGKGKYDIVWTVKNAAARRDEFPKGIRLVEYMSKEAMYEYATAGIWLCNYHLIAYFNKGLTKKWGQVYIQMWHGSFGIKRIESDCGFLRDNQSWSYLAHKNALCTDYWISNSSFETEVYKSAFYDTKNILEYGHPRNDIFFAPDAVGVRERVNRYLNLSDASNIILYVPTFREEGNIREDTLQVSLVMDALLERTGKDWIFVVRFHPRMKAEEKTAFLKKWQGILDATEYPDIQELLYRADAVLTDYSSSVFDFLLSKKMAFLFVPDLEDYIQERGFYYPLWKSPFPIARTNEELVKNIRDFDRDAYHARIKEFLRQKGSKESGTAAKQVAALMDRVLERNHYE